MSIATDLTRLQTAKADLKTAIEGKGVTVPSATKIDGYADLVDSIPSGGGGYSWNEVTMTSSFANSQGALNTLFGTISGKGGLAYIHGKAQSDFVNNQLYEICAINSGQSQAGGIVRYRNGAFNTNIIASSIDATCEIGDVYKVLIVDI